MSPLSANLLCLLGNASRILGFHFSIVQRAPMTRLPLSDLHVADVVCPLTPNLAAIFEVFARIERLLDDNRVPRRIPAPGADAELKPGFSGSEWSGTLRSCSPN